MANIATLKERMAKIQAQIEAEELQEKVQEATAKIRDSFSEAIKEALAKVEKDTGQSLATVGLGIWVAYPVGQDNPTLNVSALAVGSDGLPKALKAKASSNGSGNGNGNGNYEYVLADGRVFETCEKAVNATGETTRDASGNLLDGKKYWTRHDRLPKELAEAITKREKTPAPEASETPAPEASAPEASAPEASPATEASAPEASETPAKRNKK